MKNDSRGNLFKSSKLMSDREGRGSSFLFSRWMNFRKKRMRSESTFSQEHHHQGKVRELHRGLQVLCAVCKKNRCALLFMLSPASDFLRVGLISPMQGKAYSKPGRMRSSQHYMGKRYRKGPDHAEEAWIRHLRSKYRNLNS